MGDHSHVQYAVFNEREFAVFDKIRHYLVSKSECNMELNTFMRSLTDDQLLKQHYLQMEKFKEAMVRIKNLRLLI